MIGENCVWEEGSIYEISLYFLYKFSVNLKYALKKENLLKKKKLFKIQ